MILKCQKECIRFQRHGRETRHHKDCIYYPESISNFDEAIDHLYRGAELINNNKHISDEFADLMNNMINTICNMLEDIDGGCYK